MNDQVTASSMPRIWSIGMDDLLARARRLVAPHAVESRFEAADWAWLEAQSWELLPRTPARSWTDRITSGAVVPFHESLQSALEEAAASGKLVYVIISRYNPP